MTRTAFGEERGDFGIPPNHARVGSACLSLTSDLEMYMIPHDTHLQIGSLLFGGIDQIDLTGPFEVLSRIPNATYRIYAKTTAPVRDLKGLWLTRPWPMRRRWMSFMCRAALAKKR
jgi:hypothetical protein